MGFILFFIDGIGIGEASYRNPFFKADPEILRLWHGADLRIGGLSVKPVDPLLGIPGMPQSATGQTTIFTGINIPALLNKHHGSFPNRQMRKIIKSDNLLIKLKDIGVKGRFINAYPMHSELFSEPNIKINKDGDLIFSDNFPTIFKRRISVTSSIIVSNMVSPFDIEDIKEKRSLYQEYSNESLIKHGLDLPVYSPENAGEIISGISGNYDFILYEYFQTDVFAHRKLPEEKFELIKNLDRLIGRLISTLNKRTDTLMIISDHGNMEDASTKNHTRNYVPLILWGKGREELSREINSISDITPSILNYFKF
ncbi:MAG: alkaline phosphatase family protein [Acidobacteriota bacterium]